VSRLIIASIISSLLKFGFRIKAFPMLFTSSLLNFVFDVLVNYEKRNDLANHSQEPLEEPIIKNLKTE
jgi:hypothetical protein